MELCPRVFVISTAVSMAVFLLVQGPFGELLRRIGGTLHTGGCHDKSEGRVDAGVGSRDKHEGRVEAGGGMSHSGGCRDKHSEMLARAPKKLL